MAHPFICPACNRRTGIYEIATGLSECASCGTRWKGPHLNFVKGYATDAELEALASDLDPKDGERR
jgi:ribosomal protein L37AE/L43A